MTISGAPRFPTNVDEMREALKNLLTVEGQRQGEAYQPQASDVFISTYPKSGTTWMQQIVHGLRTGGHMDFGEITEVVPWIEACADLGQDPHAPQLARPHAFKTHLPWEDVPKGGKYIYVVRNPKDVVLSFYRFFEGFMFEPGSISLPAFAHSFFTSGSRSGRYWNHVRGYWAQRENPHVLLLTFESMKQDLGSAVRKVAKFLNLELTPEKMDIVLHQSSYGFMSSRATHFDDHFLIQKRRSFANIPESASASKVAKGKSGASDKDLPPDLHQLLDNIWAEEMAPLGFTDYDGFRQEIEQLTREPS